MSGPFEGPCGLHDRNIPGANCSCPPDKCCIPVDGDEHCDHHPEWHDERRCNHPGCLTAPESRGGVDVEALEALLAAATPVGDWYWTPYGEHGKTLARPGPELGSIFGKPTYGHEHNVLKTTDDWAPTDADAALIVAAVNALPDLLREVADARGREVERAEVGEGIARAIRKGAELGRRTTLDPGAFVKRGPDPDDGEPYGERLDLWQARALDAAIAHEARP